MRQEFEWETLDALFWLGFLSIYIFYVALDITLDSFEENAVYQRFKCPGFCLQVREVYKIITLIYRFLLRCRDQAVRKS